MVKEDSHMIDHGLNLRPVMFHTQGPECVCLVAKSQEDNGAEGIVLWSYPLESDFSSSLSVSLSSEST